jgi:hypothetical protein
MRDEPRFPGPRERHVRCSAPPTQVTAVTRWLVLLFFLLPAVGGCAALNRPAPQIGGHPDPRVALEIPRPPSGQAHLVLISGFSFDLAIVDASGRSFGVVTPGEVIVLSLPVGTHRLFAYRPSVSVLTFCGNHCGVAALVATVRDRCMYDASIDPVKAENHSSLSPAKFGHDEYTAHPMFTQLRPVRPFTLQTRSPVKVPMSPGPVASKLAKEIAVSGAQQLAEPEDPRENTTLDPNISDCVTLATWDDN